MSVQPILIVDDSPVCLRILEQHLRDAGYWVVSVSSGREAWRLLQDENQQYGMVMVDRLMVDMSGVALIKAIKSRPHLSSIPLVMLTGQADPEEYIQAISEGIFEFLYKPIHPSLLLHVVEQALDRRVVGQGNGNNAHATT
jgi:DNA-binding NtrC family response regulator